MTKNKYNRKEDKRVCTFSMRGRTCWCSWGQVFLNACFRTLLSEPDVGVLTTGSGSGTSIPYGPFVNSFPGYWFWYARLSFTCTTPCLLCLSLPQLYDMYDFLRSPHAGKLHVKTWGGAYGNNNKLITMIVSLSLRGWHFETVKPNSFRDSKW